jgi:hypothetical protein
MYLYIIIQKALSSAKRRLGRNRSNTFLIPKLRLGTPSAKLRFALASLASVGKRSHSRQEKWSAFASEESFQGLNQPGIHFPLLPPTGFYRRE